MLWKFFFTAVTAFLTKIHRIHCISYKKSPKNLNPGCLNGTIDDLFSLHIKFLATNAHNLSEQGRLRPTAQKLKNKFRWQKNMNDFYNKIMIMSIH